MNERKIIAYKNYYKDFMDSLSFEEQRKVHYVLDLLASQERISAKFIRHIRDELYELRVKCEGNIYRIFFIFDEGRIVVLFNGFHKKTEKTPENEIRKALKIKNEYYEHKQ
jgi:phage-related protein